MSYSAKSVRFRHRCFLVAALLPTLLAFGEDRKAKPSRDYVVRAYPAQITAALDEKDLTLQQRMPCDRQLFKVFPKGSIPEKPGDVDARTVYVIHIGEWNQVNGSYGLVKSRWYAFRPVFQKNVCSFVQSGFKAKGDPLLYGDKTILFLGVNYFKDPIDSRNFKAGYKVSVTPDVAENVQDLGLLITGVLGATVPTGGGLESVEEATQATYTLITFAKIKGLKRLPFLMNFTFTLALSPQGTLPPARVGVPYSSNITPTGGNGTYKFSIIDGSLPDGLGIDPLTGVVSGTPAQTSDASTQTAEYDFQVFIVDGSQPPNTGVVKAKLTVVPSIIIPAPETQAKTQTMPLATKGIPYKANLKTAAFGAQVILAKGDDFPAWLALDANTGSVNGIPDTVGKFSFIQQTAGGATKPLTFDLAVVAPLPEGVEGSLYDSGVSAGPSKSAYTFSIVEGKLPKGLFLNPGSGSISGVPKENGDAFPLTIQMSDSGDASKAVRLQTALKINKAAETMPSFALSVSKPKEVELHTLSSGTVGLPYGAIKISGAGAPPESPNYVFDAEGNLPNGLKLSSRGILDGNFPLLDTTYCFLITDETQHPSKRNQDMLRAMCFVARGLNLNIPRVLGVATTAANRGYDFFFIDRKNWTPEDEDLKLKVQAEYGIFTSPRRTQAADDEYPPLRRQ